MILDLLGVLAMDIEKRYDKEMIDFAEWVGRNNYVRYARDWAKFNRIMDARKPVQPEEIKTTQQLLNEYKNELERKKTKETEI